MPKQPPREELTRVLLERLRKAIDEHAAAGTRFDFLVKDLPSGVSSPEVAEQIQRAGKDYHLSLDNYVRALNRYMNFTLRQTTPRDLSNRNTSGE